MATSRSSVRSRGACGAITGVSGNLGGIADVGKGVASDFRGAAHEMGIGGGADTDGKELRVRHFIGNEPEEFAFVSDRAVGQEHDLAQASLFGRLPERAFESRAHHGSAFGA